MSLHPQNNQTEEQMVEKIVEHWHQHKSTALNRLFDLLRIQSISTDQAYHQECEKAALWLERDLTSMGFKAETIHTKGKPFILAEEKQNNPTDTEKSKRKHFLFYGHYDVQPVDPLALWDGGNPFEPRIFEGPDGPAIWGRGTSDDKGQLMTFVEAVRTIKAVCGKLPCDLTILFEGEEETGSPSLPEFLANHKQRLKADIAFVCDTPMIAPEKPAITTMLRGMITHEIIIHGPSRDLHSGFFGGAALNPIRILTRIISDLHDDEGRVNLEGFYDGVDEPSDQIKQDWQALGLTEEAFLSPIGLHHSCGETDRSIPEQIWSRPTFDVNGIVGGYTGEGSKTIIPSQASAKLSFRMVGKQNPAKILVALKLHVAERLPKDCRVEHITHGASAAISFDSSDEIFKQAADCLEQAFGNKAAMVGCGGSIPIVGQFKNQLNMDSLLIGFAQDNDNIHSPNEKYNLRSFEQGVEAWIRILMELS